MLTRPTPLEVNGGMGGYRHLTSMSIVKQCLLFKDMRASINVYKLGAAVSLPITDYISCIQDLQLVIDWLPQ